MSVKSKNQITLNFSNETYIAMFERFLYSVDGQYHEEVKKTGAGTFTLTFEDANHAYRFGYGWCACQWNKERLEKFKG